MSQLSIRIKVPQHASLEEKRHRYNFMRREFGNNLLDFMDEQKSRVVLEVIETRDVEFCYGVPHDVVTLSVQASSVPRVSLSVPYYAPRKKTVWEKIKDFYAESERQRRYLWGE